jgi:hypothetical protein
MEFISELIITPEIRMNYSSFYSSINGKQTQSFPFDLNLHSARIELSTAYCIYRMIKGTPDMF